MIDAITGWDTSILLYVQEHIRADWLTPIMKVITHLSDKGILWIALCILLMIPRKTRRIGIVAAMALAFSFLCNNLLLKNIVGRIRPYEAIHGLLRLIDAESDASFPSGHTACCFSVSTAILLAAKKKWPGILLLVFSLITGFTRIYVGVHYPSDVIAAMITAPICAIAMYFAFKAVEKRMQERKQERDDANAMMV